jgi:hypothetical protein
LALSQKSQPGVTDICSAIWSKKEDEPPKISGLTCQIKQPAVSIRKRLLVLNNQFRRGISIINRRAQEEEDAISAQLASQIRAEAEEAANSARRQEARRLHVEREERRIADFQKREEETSRRKRETHQLQRDDMRRIYLELNLPQDTKMAHRRRSASTKSSRVEHSTPSNFEDANDPFSENYQVVAGVFPANNRRQTERAAWSGKQQDRFIKIMMRGAAGM